MERQNETGRPNEQQPAEFDEKRWATIAEYVDQTYGSDASFMYEGAILSLSQFKIICGRHIVLLEDAQLVGLLDRYHEPYVSLEADARTSQDASRAIDEGKRKGDALYELYVQKEMGA